MVCAMTSHSSLTSRRIFVSRQHSTESDFRIPINDQIMSVAKCRGSWVVGRGRGSWVWVKKVYKISDKVRAPD